MTPISARDLCALLERSIEHPNGVAIAFDGDGTLWSGDVGEDVFEYCVEQGLLHDEAEHLLRQSAQEYQLGISGTTADLATQLFAAYRAGRYPERVVCEMMTWCYAGMSLAELAQITHAALDESRIRERVQPEVRRVVDWALERNVTLLVISASPAPVVRQAVVHCGVAPSSVVAAEPIVEQEMIKADPRVFVPYAESKVSCGRERLGGRHWLASFGDNVFDSEMLHQAQVGIAVRPKPALTAKLGNDSGFWLLEPE